MPWKKTLAYVTGEVNQTMLLKIEYLVEENRVLRNQIQHLHLSDPERRILAEKGKALGKLLDDVITIVKPETLLKWHKKLVAQKWDYSPNRKQKGPGRPKIGPHLVNLILTMARENPSWGFDRIAGALNNLGHHVSDQTVGNVLRDNGMGTAPERSRNTTWSSFIRRHQDVIWATDFLTTEVWSKAGLLTIYILFFIHLKTKKIVIGGTTHTPDAQWVQQIARNVTSDMENLPPARYLIHDRDTKYTASFDQLFESVGIEPLILPPKSPNLNAFAERWVRSVKTECLDQMIFFGQNSLRYALKEYAEHFEHERNHQGIQNLIPFPDERLDSTEGQIIRSERLGGLLNFYHRQKAA